jgi:hypothetical protein
VRRQRVVVAGRLLEGAQLRHLEAPAPTYDCFRRRLEFERAACRFCCGSSRGLRGGTGLAGMLP